VFFQDHIVTIFLALWVILYFEEKKRDSSTIHVFYKENKLGTKGLWVITKTNCGSVNTMPEVLSNES